MGPKGFKDMDKRHYHVKDVGDVIEWFAYRASRDEQALKVIKSLRNSYNMALSTNKAYMRKEQINNERSAAQAEAPLAAGAPGDLQSLSQPTEAAKDEAIISELQEVLDQEREAKLQEETVERTDEEGDVDTKEYSVFFVKGTPRFKKGNVMVKAIDVPEAVREKLLAEKAGGES